MRLVPRYLSVMILCALTMPVPASAGQRAPTRPNATPANVKDTLIALEMKLWDAWKTHNRKPLEELLAPDYFYVGDDGEKDLAAVMREFDKEAVLQDYSVGPIRARALSADVWILTYRATLRGTISGKRVDRDDLEASLWVRRGGQWKNAFLHEVEAPRGTK